jgi:pimeloyl-ACP methyl ester carboxylesterase
VSDLFVEAWGAGTPVVLVHDSLATGAEEWQAQRPLADEGFRLLVLDRRGCGKTAFNGKAKQTGTYAVMNGPPETSGGPFRPVKATRS